MYYIGYLSSEALALSERDLKVILEKSRIKNISLGITGILVYIDGAFLQILEGKREKVEFLYKTISSDFRHLGVIRIIEGEILQRNFQDWSMGFKKLTKKEIEGFMDLNYLQTLEKPISDQAHPLFVFLKSFYLGNI